MDLIRTRLRPPTRGTGLIERSELDKVAERIRNRRIVFVKAPAGYGKSSLLHRWHIGLREKNIATGWLSLDQTQDDLRSFFLYSTAAIREHMSGFGTEFLEFLDTAREPTAMRVATVFVNALLMQETDIVLFIDDFHLLSDKSAVRAIEIVLQDAPPNFHLVIASRASPSFSLARLRMLGETDEIGSGQLRFDANELNSFIRLSGRQPLSNSETAQLLTTTEGWPAGIQLALISLAQHEDIQPFLDRFSGEHRVVSEFLFDDVLEHLPEETVDFLLKTSILEIFNHDLCDVLVDTGEARATIKDLSARSLFIFSLDDEKIWYRYHHLFSEVLQRMLCDRMPDQIAELHRRASLWFAERGFFEMAFNHAIKAEDWLGAAVILDTNCKDLFYDGKLSTLTRFAEQIPPDILNGFPRIQLELAWSIILKWRFDDALAIIRQVERTIENWKDSGKEPKLIEEVERIVLHRRMMLALFMDDAKELERSVLELLHDFPSGDPYLQGTLENCLIYARREMFRLDRVDQMDRGAREFFERSGSKFVLVWHEAILAPTYHLMGDTEAAVEALLSAIEVAEYVEGPATPLQAMPGLLLAEILYERNETDAAAKLVERFGKLTLRLGFVDNLSAYFVTRIRLCFRKNDSEKAAALIAEGVACADFHGFSRLKQKLWVESIRLAARTGDIAFLRSELADAEKPTQKARLMPGQRTTSKDEHFVLGWCIATCQLGKARAAADVMRRWVSFTADRKALRSEIRFLIALACALSQDGETGEALRKLRVAVQKSARPRFISSFLDGGEPVLNLLRELFDTTQPPTGPVSVFGVELLQAFARTSPESNVVTDLTVGSEQEVDLAPPEALNEKEREVLRFASHGKSNKDIARVLGMTEGTVKWYMQQVFAKLDVRRRTLAVQRARKFGLL